jgi:hypothetical protein
VAYRLTLYGQDVRLADVLPAGQPSGPTVVLFHGMNFGGFYFAGPTDSFAGRRPRRSVRPDLLLPFLEADHPVRIP